VGSLRHGFGVVLEVVTRAARGFLQPCRAISEKDPEIGIEGENILKILPPGVKRRYCSVIYPLLIPCDGEDVI